MIKGKIYGKNVWIGEKLVKSRGTVKIHPCPELPDGVVKLLRNKKQ